ncbi:MAG: uroporphyrinogen-III synthase [Formosimonas sp.]
MSRVALLTRPWPVSDGVAQALAAAGMTYIDAPTLQVTAQVDEVFEAQLFAQSYDGMVCVSQHAVFFAAQRMAALPSHMWCAAVGVASGQAVARTWPTARLIVPHEGDSQDTDGLWRALTQADVLKPQARVLLVRAQTGRDVLRQRLLAAHLSVEVWPCYRREPLVWQAAQRAQVEAAMRQHGLVVALTSIEGLRALLANCSDEILRQPALCIHPVIAKAAQDCGFVRVTCVSPHEMSAALLTHRA